MVTTESEIKQEPGNHQNLILRFSSSPSGLEPVTCKPQTILHYNLYPNPSTTSTTTTTGREKNLHGWQDTDKNLKGNSVMTCDIMTFAVLTYAVMTCAVLSIFLL